jgi:hypothetical protein
MCRDLSNKIITKELAFGCKWSGTVTAREVMMRLWESCPAGFNATAGLRWCDAMWRQQPRGDPDE